MKQNEIWMLQAIKSAQEGIENKEGGPFGACVIHKNQLIAVTHNTVLKDLDPTAHAEMNAIRQACLHLGTHLLSDCILFTTAEPCPMCLSATYWARIPTIHIGISKECVARYGFDDSFFYQELEKPSKDRKVSTHHGLCKEECEDVFKSWAHLNGQLY